MRELLWSDQARSALFEAAAYHARTDPAFAIELLERIETAPAPLLDFPEIGSLTTSGARKWRAPHTPYLLLYDVTDGAIQVIAVHHVRSNFLR